MVHTGPEPGYRVGCVSGQSTLRAFGDVSTDSSMGTAPIAISVETSLTRPFPGRAVIVCYIQRGSAELDPLQY